VRCMVNRVQEGYVIHSMFRSTPRSIISTIFHYSSQKLNDFRAYQCLKITHLRKTDYYIHHCTICTVLYNVRHQPVFVLQLR